jgi:calcium/proton exchanger cax
LPATVMLQQNTRLSLFVSPVADPPRRLCVVVLVASTVAFAMVSETLIDSLDQALDYLSVPPSFAGLTIIALVPNIAEFVNAIQFALQKNISLSIEIGRSAAAQISLLQVPALVVMSMIVRPNDPVSVL